MPAEFPNSDPVAATPQATPFDNILAQCRDLVCERLCQALAGMLDKVDNALSALINETRDPKVQKIYAQTRDKALTQREAIEKQFRARYLREFQQRSNRVKKIGDSFAEIDLSSLELELVGDDDLDETLKFNAMATKLRHYCDEELIALDQRVGVLLGDASLQAEDNPLTPQAICDAYKDTCRQLDSNVEVRMVLLRLFDDHVLDDIRAVYKAVNGLLVQNSILPKIRISARKEGGKSPASVARTAGEAPRAIVQAEHRAPDGEQDLFSILKNLRTGNLNAMTQTGAAGATGAPAQGAAAMPGMAPVGGMTGAGGGADGLRAALQGTELLGLLTRIQLGDISGVTGNILPMAPLAGEPGTTNVLRELKGTSVGTGMNQLDTMTLDIMSLVFDQLFDDPKIPVGVKGLIGRLQIPMLKVAIADKTFFSKKAHPARQLLDTLGEISLRLPADFNASSPQFGRMEVILQELIDGFENNMEIFDVARGRLETLIAEEDRRVEQETLSAANQIEQKERLALAKAVAQAEIKARVRASNVPVPVLEFLIQHWVQVLLVVHVVDGEDSDAWKNALETMDLLIWSVEPKHTVDERRELAALVREVLQRIAAGLRMVDIEDAVRSEFFAELRELHTRIIGKPEEDDAAATHDASRANDTAIVDSASAAKPESTPAAVLPPAPFVASATAPAAKLASVLDLEIAPAPATQAAPVPAAQPAGAPATETAPVPVVEPAPAPAAIPASMPDLEFAPAPAVEPAPVPAAEPAFLLDLEFTTAPAAQATPAPAAEPAFLPDLEFAPALATEVAPVPSVESAFLLDLEFTPAPAAQAPAVPAEKPAPASAAEFVSLPDLKFTPAPAAELASLPGLNFSLEPAAKSPPAPARPVPAPAEQPAPAPVAKSTAAPAAKTAVPTAQSVSGSAAKPTAAQPAPASAAQQATASAAKPAAAQPAPVPAAQHVAVPGAKPAASPAAQPAPASAARPAPGPAAPRVTAPVAKPAVAQPGPASAAKPAAAQPAPPSAMQRVTAPPAAKPGASPTAQAILTPAAKPTAAPAVRPAPAPAAKPGIAPAARSVSAPPAKPSPTPGKGVQPPPRSPAAVNFTAPVTVQNPFGGGKVEVDDLDFTVKLAVGAKPEATLAELPGNLAVGTWVGIREKDEKAPRKSAKLSFISPLKTRYLFVDKQGKTTLDCSRADLARRFKIGEVVIMDKVLDVPLFERITEGLVGKLGGGKPTR